MPRRSKGRPPGSRNKATLEKLHRAKVVEQLAAQSGVPGAREAVRRAMGPITLAKDELEELVPILKGVVAYFQKPPIEAVQRGEVPTDAQWDRFKKWVELYIDTLVRLADFQSPKFKALAVSMPGQPGDQARLVEHDENVVSIDDPVAISRVYQRIMGGGARS